MNKIAWLLLPAFLLYFSSSAQIQKDNVFIGGDITNLSFTLGGGGAFSAGFNPKAAFFIKDDIAVGAYIDFSLSTSKGAGTRTNYGVGALGRYYVNNSKTNVLKHGRLFFEGNAGIHGLSLPNGANTVGLGLGIGPGYTYFITPNIGLEALLKYNPIVGFGNNTYNSTLNLGIGLQVYLPGKKIRNIVNEAQ